MSEPNDTEREAARVAAVAQSAQSRFIGFGMIDSARRGYEAGYAEALAARREEVERLTRERDEYRHALEQSGRNNDALVIAVYVAAEQRDEATARERARIVALARVLAKDRIEHGDVLSGVTLRRFADAIERGEGEP